MTLPLLVLIDIQREYETPGRPYHIPGIRPSLVNARRVLEHAREQGWEIAHVRHLKDRSPFERGTEWAGYIDGFEPRPGEREFEKRDYSCYSSEDFALYAKSRGDAGIHVIGYGSTKCCLATLMDAYAVGQKAVFVADASGAVASGELDGESLHRHATEILRSFCRVLGTEEVLRGA